MKKRNVSLLALILMVSSTLIITGCGKTDEKTPDSDKDNTPVVEKKLDDKTLDVEPNEDETDVIINEEVLTEENYKMHSKITTSEKAGKSISMEMIVQKKGKDIAVEYIKFPVQDMLPGVKMKKTIILDGKESFVNYEIKGKDIWTKIMNTNEANTLEKIENGINTKKLLAKLKEKNIKKIEKEVDGNNYDCYNQDGESICFDDEELKYIFGNDGSVTEMVEYSDDVDSDAFDIPAEDKLTSQAEMSRIMMEAVGANLPAEETK